MSPKVGRRKSERAKKRKKKRGAMERRSQMQLQTASKSLTSRCAKANHGKSFSKGNAPRSR
jgi:hypothetical protein